ncbi:hypothetical protein BX600DRAFT_517312 [Xylariales sp. PMI_506]|nr:hypothetical protein BX600DRAFT_517312 [Xylariales sp. PMI_506]
MYEANIDLADVRPDAATVPHFEALLWDIQDRAILDECATLEAVIVDIRSGQGAQQEAARERLSELARAKDRARIRWEAETFRAIEMDVRKGDCELAVESIEDFVAQSRERMLVSPFNEEQVDPEWYAYTHPGEKDGNITVVMSYPTNQNPREYWNIEGFTLDLVQLYADSWPGSFAAWTNFDVEIQFVQNTTSNFSASWNISAEDTSTTTATTTVSTTISIASAPSTSTPSSAPSKGIESSDDGTKEQSGSNKVPAIIGSTVGGIAFVSILIFVYLWCSRRRYRGRSSLHSNPSMEMSSEIHQPPYPTHTLAHIKQLLQKAKFYRDLPKTQESIEFERQHLASALEALQKLDETPEIQRRMFLCLQGLQENWQDGLALSIDNDFCDRASDESKRLMELSGRIFDHKLAVLYAHFYTGQVFFVRARIQELQLLPNRTEIFRLYHNAWEEFSNAKRIVNLATHRTDNSDDKLYGIRSMYACAFISSRVSDGTVTESEWLDEPHYSKAKQEFTIHGFSARSLKQLDDDLISRWPHAY